MKIFNSQNFLSAKKKECFEGWYFKTTLNNQIFAFIVGVCKNKTEQYSFIQFIDKNSSHYFKYEYGDFYFCKENMEITIADNTFSLKGITADLANDNISITCNLKFEQANMFKKSLYAPSAMGPFSYMPFFCSHAVVALNIKTSGQITIDGTTNSGEGNAYIEKDYGNSFPKNYIWTHAQSHNYDNPTSIVFALAYPLIFGIKGFICIVHHNNKQYNLSLYSGAKLEYMLGDDSFNFTLKKRKIKIDAKVKFDKSFFKSLAAPCENQMSETIFENVNAEIELGIKTCKTEDNTNLPAAFEMYGNF